MPVYILQVYSKRNVEETGKLESSDRLNLESDAAGQSGAAAGVGTQSEAGLSREKE